MKSTYTVYKAWKYNQMAARGMLVKEIAQKEMVSESTVRQLIRDLGTVPGDRIQRAVDLFTIRRPESETH